MIMSLRIRPNSALFSGLQGLKMVQLRTTVATALDSTSPRTLVVQVQSLALWVPSLVTRRPWSIQSSLRTLRRDSSSLQGQMTSGLLEAQQRRLAPSPTPTSQPESPQAGRQGTLLSLQCCLDTIQHKAQQSTRLLKQLVSPTSPVSLLPPRDKVLSLPAWTSTLTLAKQVIHRILPTTNPIKYTRTLPGLQS